MCQRTGLREIDTFGNAARFHGGSKANRDSGRSQGRPDGSPRSVSTPALRWLRRQARFVPEYTAWFTSLTITYVDDAERVSAPAYLAVRTVRPTVPSTKGRIPPWRPSRRQETDGNVPEFRVGSRASLEPGRFGGVRFTSHRPRAYEWSRDRSPATQDGDCKRAFSHAPDGSAGPGRARRARRRLLPQPPGRAGRRRDGPDPQRVLDTAPRAGGQRPHPARPAPAAGAGATRPRVAAHRRDRYRAA